ncbi:MAG: hypothetical protein GEU90_12940 [Gemmatimonas sp.]|nr:hypothetical protein [Gemmatimonas sp.]
MERPLTEAVDFFGCRRLRVHRHMSCDRDGWSWAEALLPSAAPIVVPTGQKYHGHKRDDGQAVLGHHDGVGDGLALAGCDDDVTRIGVEEPEWTVMIYLAGDNNLSEDGIQNIDDMEAAGVDPQVDVVLQAEFSPASLAATGCDASCFNRPNFNTFRYAITGEGESVPGPDGPTIDIGNRNMTDPAELNEFVHWAQTNHPATKYLLVLWDHGGGYLGLLSDETSAGRTESCSSMSCRVPSRTSTSTYWDSICA